MVRKGILGLMMVLGLMATAVLSAATASAEPDRMSGVDSDSSNRGYIRVELGGDVSDDINVNILRPRYYAERAADQNPNARGWIKSCGAWSAEHDIRWSSSDSIPGVTISDSPARLRGTPTETGYWRVGFIWKADMTLAHTGSGYSAEIDGGCRVSKSVVVIIVNTFQPPVIETD